MSALQKLQELLPKYEIIYRGDNRYKIIAPFGVLCAHIIKIKNNIKTIKSIHEHCGDILLLLLSNNFILSTGTYRHLILDLTVDVFVSQLWINYDAIYNIDKFYQIMREKLNLKSLNKHIFKNE